MTTKGVEAASEATRFALRMGLAVSEVISFAVELGEECPMINFVFDTLEAIREKIGDATSNERDLTLLEERCSYFTACAIARGRSYASRVDLRPLVELVEDVESLVEKCGQRWCVCTIINAASDKQEITELHQRFGGLAGQMGLDQIMMEDGKVEHLAKLLEDRPACSLAVAGSRTSKAHTASLSQSNEDLDESQSFPTSPWGAQPTLDPGEERRGLLAHFQRLLQEAQRSLDEPSYHPRPNGQAHDPPRNSPWDNMCSGVVSPADRTTLKELHEAEAQLKMANRLGQNNLLRHQEVVESLRHLARLTESHDWTKARRLYLRALAMDDVKLGPESLEVAETLQSLGRGCLRAGRPKESEAAFSKSLKILRARLDPENEEVGYALEALGSSLLEQERTDEAEPLLRGALDILDDVSTLRARFVVLRIQGAEI